MLDAGDLGQLQYIYSNRLNHGTIRTRENVFWSFAPHDIALFQYFFNDAPIEINSNGVDILQPGIHDTTITSFKLVPRIIRWDIFLLVGYIHLRNIVL